MAQHKDRGLGKGLGALLGDAALQTQEGGSVLLPIAQVEPGLNQPRKRFDPESLADELWEALHPENKVALFVRYIRLEDGTYQQVLRNKY